MLALLIETERAMEESKSPFIGYSVFGIPASVSRLKPPVSRVAPDQAAAVDPEMPRLVAMLMRTWLSYNSQRQWMYLWDTAVSYLLE